MGSFIMFNILGISSIDMDIFEASHLISSEIIENISRWCPGRLTIVAIFVEYCDGEVRGYLVKFDWTWHFFFLDISPFFLFLLWGFSSLKKINWIEFKTRSSFFWIFSELEQSLGYPKFWANLDLNEFARHYWLHEVNVATDCVLQTVLVSWRILVL